MRRSFVCLTSLALGVCGLAQADLNDGLVAYYPFNGNANDESGNNNHFTVLGAPNYVDGAKGQGIKFDGDDDCVYRSTLKSSNGFTWSGWFQAEEDPTYFVGLGAPTFQYTPSLSFIDGKISYSVFRNGSVSYASDSPRNFWTHIAIAVENDGTKYLFVNGDLVSENDNPAGFGQINPHLILGARHINEPSSF